MNFSLRKLKTCHMGVIRLFDWFTRKMTEHRIVYETPLTKVYGLWLDANALLHSVRAQALSNTRAKMESDGYSISNYKQAHDVQQYFLLEFERLLFRELAAYIRKHSPTVLGIMIDGVPPLAKAAEQRRRRYNNIPPPEGRWLIPLSSTAITPGTDLMIFIDGLFRKFLRDPWVHLSNALNEEEGQEEELQQQQQITQRMTILYSSHLEPGEGEHKILRHLRDDSMYPIDPSTGTSNVTHLVYSDDADMLILLPLVLQSRESEDKTIIPNLHVLMRRDRAVTVSANAILELMNDKLQISMQEFVILVTLVGNDFLPGTPSITVTHDLDTAIENYNSIEGRRLTLLDNTGTITLQLLQAYFFQLAVGEVGRLKDYVNRTDSDRLTTPDSVGHYAIIDRSNGESPLDLGLYKALWYRRALGPRITITDDNETEVLSRYVNSQSLHNMLAQYVYGLQWVVDYYSGKPINTDWWYPYEYAPLLAELAQQEIRLPIVPQPTGIRNVIDNMLLVIPPTFSDLLPSIFAKLMHAGSPIEDLYPITVRRDRDRIHLYRDQDPKEDGIPILPPLNPARIKNAVLAVLSVQLKELIEPAIRMYDQLMLDADGYHDYLCDWTSNITNVTDKFKRRVDTVNLTVGKGRNPNPLQFMVMEEEVNRVGNIVYIRQLSQYQRDYLRVYTWVPDEEYIANHYNQPAVLSQQAIKGDYSVVYQPSRQKKYTKRYKTKPVVGTMAQHYPVEALNFKQLVGSVGSVQTSKTRTAIMSGSKNVNKGQYRRIVAKKTGGRERGWRLG